MIPHVKSACQRQLLVRILHRFCDRFTWHFVEINYVESPATATADCFQLAIPRHVSSCLTECRGGLFGRFGFGYQGIIDVFGDSVY